MLNWVMVHSRAAYIILTDSERRRYPSDLDGCEYKDMRSHSSIHKVPLLALLVNLMIIVCVFHIDNL